MPTAATPTGPVARYVSPTITNARELGTYLLLGILLLAALGLPWIMLRVVNGSGLNFDTWKLPQAGAGLAQLLPQPAKEYRETDAGLLAIYGDGVWAIAQPHDSRAAAVDAWRARWKTGAWPPGVMGAATSIGGGQYLAFASMRDGRLLEWVFGQHILQFFAPDDTGLTLMIQNSPMIDAPGEPRYGVGDAPLGIRLLRFSGIWTALALNALLLLALAGTYWFGIRSLRRNPPADARKIGREALRTQLIGLNTPNSPLLIEEQEPYHLIARWKVDEPEQAQWLAGRNLRDAWQLDIYLGDNATAGVLETNGRIAWNGRATPPQAAISWNYMREVGQKQPDAPALPASALPDPEGTVLPTQSIVPADYRSALRHLLLSSGWSWQPLLLRPLVWEYR